VPIVLALVLELFPKFGAAHAADTALLLERLNIVEAAKRGGEWEAARDKQVLGIGERVRTGERSRALVRLTNEAVFRLDAKATITILPEDSASRSGLELLRGLLYFFSRDRPQDVRVRTPSANGILRGTEFVLGYDGGGKTTLVLLDGEVDIGNDAGRVTASGGEVVELVPGRKPRKTSLIEARSVIQWCLYYPAVLDPAALGLTVRERAALAPAIEAYGAGDLPGALRAFSRSPQVSSPGGQVFAAAMELAAGQVDDAERRLRGVGTAVPGAAALRTLVAAVNLGELPSGAAGGSAAEQLAFSYYEQSRSRLESAREAARRAVASSPRNGYAWTRLAELEFSFGRTREAMRALEKGRAFAPRNAHAAVLAGFLRSAANRTSEAHAAFEEAIALDPSLGTGWFGRGLARIRSGDLDGGRLDLQAAAGLEPNRSLFRSYLAKAWSETQQPALARKELDRAFHFDREDPTPWLYRALQNRDDNRMNDAVRDLERSMELNDNRSIFRSRSLLDEDRAVRGANLATIYQSNAMNEVAIREAAWAVQNDYANASAHLFLGNSYNALRDPTRVVLRYETVAQNEFLLATLLAPVGSGILSANVSAQEYSKLFASDGFGFTATSEYASSGVFREIGSLRGTFGNFEFALDGHYFRDEGSRPNSDSRNFVGNARVKFQLSPFDTVLLLAGYQELRAGDTRQLYDPRLATRTLRVNEDQGPGSLLVGYRREWGPGAATLFLGGRVQSRQTLRLDAGVPVFDLLPSDSPLLPSGLDDIRRGLVLGGVQAPTLRQYYDIDIELDGAELQQIIPLGPLTTVAGVRYQEGTIEPSAVLKDGIGATPGLLDRPASDSAFSAGFERLSLYLYTTLRLSPAVSILGGLTYDRLDYPLNIRIPPLRDDRERIEHWSPKVALFLQPARWLRLRGFYSEAISGVNLDESFRLEPAQIAGFPQGFRTLLNESVGGSLSAARYKLAGAAADVRLPGHTYLGLEWNLRKQEATQRAGNLERFLSGSTAVPLGTAQDGQGFDLVQDYEEQEIAASMHKLLGDQWSVGASYRFIRSEYALATPALAAFPGASRQTRSSELHQLELTAAWHHPSGFFARCGGIWTRQDNDGFEPAEPGDDFWQVNLLAGYRFRSNRGDVSLGVRNLLDSDYRLEPLNPYSELPRERVFVARCRIEF
jgi:tetratricopeptide (TPR) repeat protein